VSASRWLRVTASNPCPICRKGDWCRVTADGSLAGCMRVETGCFRVKEGRDGSTVYLHRLTSDPQSRTSIPPAGGIEPQRADADTLNEIYSAFLAQLTLGKAHRENLVARGLSDEAIDRNGYKTLPIGGRTRIAAELRERFGDKVLRVPGFVVKEGDNGRYVTVRGPAGMVVPVRDPASRIVALKVRRDGPTDAGSRYVYVSSNGHGGPGPGPLSTFPWERQRSPKPCG